MRAAAPSAVLWQRYDEAVPDPESAAQQVATFLGATLDARAIAEIASECSVDSAKKRCEVVHQSVINTFRELRQQNPTVAQAWLRQIQNDERIVQDEEFLLPHNHVSKHKGASGQWRDALTAAELAALTDRHGSWFAHAEYAV